jgi:hypothetical protein
MKYILGIDIGGKGAAALFAVNGDVIQLAYVVSFVDPDWYTTLRNWVYLYQPELVWVEHVHAMPAQGLKSAFSFGRRRGEVEMLLHLMQCPFQIVEPTVWQNKVMLPRNPEIFGKSKRRAQRNKDIKAMAMSMWPCDLARFVYKGSPHDPFAACLIGYAAAKTLIGRTIAPEDLNIDEYWPALKSGQDNQKDNAPHCSICGFTEGLRPDIRGELKCCVCFYKQDDQTRS